VSRPRPDAPDGKREGAFRTISEVSALLGVPQHVLRFWETRFPALKPLKHVGGRRYYRPEDIRLLTRIRDLLHRQGYTIRGARTALRQGGGADGPSAVTASPTPDLDELRRLRARLRHLRDRLAAPDSR